MRKLPILLTLAAGIAVIGTGCVKDKGYDNNEYGVQIQEKKGVAFPQSASSPISFGVNSSATAQVVDGPQITLEQSGTASSDVNVTLQLNNTLVTDLGYTPLPAGAFSINLNQKVSAGSRISDPIKFTLNNTAVLDPTKVYGIGLTIISADGGYTIASNQKNIVIAINIKNAYDGKYNLKVRFYHPTSAPTYPLLVTNQIEMITSGPNSVKIYCLIPGLVGYYHPFSTGSAISAFSGQEPEFTINAATNAVTVQNTAPGAVTFYEMGKGFDNLGYNSRRDPATKIIYANFGYNLDAGQMFNAATTRMFLDTLTYTGPR